MGFWVACVVRWRSHRNEASYPKPMGVSGMLPNTCCEGKGFFAEKQANSLLHLSRLEKTRTPSKTRLRGTNNSLPKS